MNQYVIEVNLVIKVILNKLKSIIIKMNIKNYQQLEPFSYDKEKKRRFFEKEINTLTLHHYNNSKEYKKILNFFGYKTKNNKLEQVPFLPSKLFTT